MSFIPWPQQKDTSNLVTVFLDLRMADFFPPFFYGAILGPNFGILDVPTAKSTGFDEGSCFSGQKSAIFDATRESIDKLPNTD